MGLPERASSTTCGDFNTCCSRSPSFKPVYERAQPSAYFTVVACLNSSILLDSSKYCNHQVMVRPSLPPLTLDALPAALAPHASLAAELPPADWDRLCRSACRAASFRRARACLE